MGKIEVTAFSSRGDLVDELPRLTSHDAETWQTKVNIVLMIGNFYKSCIE